MLRTHVAALDADTLPLLDQAIRLAREGGPATVRQAASALYHVTSAAAMAWEAARLGDPRRARLARAVLAHRVLPRNPLAPDEDEPIPE